MYNAYKRRNRAARETGHIGKVDGSTDSARHGDVHVFRGMVAGKTQLYVAIDLGNKDTQSVHEQAEIRMTYGADSYGFQSVIWFCLMIV